MSRTQNSLKNMAASLIGQFGSIVLRFACRTVFIYVLGKEFLGISSLYTNILTLLSVSELGISSAITFSLYRPLAEGDNAKVSAIMQFFKNAYRIVGLVILVIGLCLIPFLPTLMNGTTDKVNIYLYYLLYLAQTVVTYFFFAYKQTILFADQKKYLVDYVVFGANVVTTLLQILVLVIRESFFEYTIALIISGVVTNLIVAIIVDKKYPYLKDKAPKLSGEEVKEIFKQVYAMFLYRVCNVVGTATDNLIISSNINVLMVGLYDNYYLIINAVQKVLSHILGAFSGSLGNLYVLESDTKNEQVFRCLNLVNLWLITLSSVCFMILFQPFITMWIGEEYLFTPVVLYIIVMNFATNYMQGVMQIYKDVTGLFVKGKYRPVATVILNLVISIILVKKMGIAGVFLGSIISRMCTTWAYDGWLIYTHAFHMSPIKFYADSIVCAIVITVLSIGIETLCTYAEVPVTVWGFIARGIICVAITNMALLLLYGRREEFKIVAQKAKSIFFSRFIKGRN